MDSKKNHNKIKSDSKILLFVFVCFFCSFFSNQFPFLFEFCV